MSFSAVNDWFKERRSNFKTMWSKFWNEKSNNRTTVVTSWKTIAYSSPAQLLPVKKKLQLFLIFIEFTIFLPWQSGWHRCALQLLSNVPRTLIIKLWLNVFAALLDNYLTGKPNTSLSTCIEIKIMVTPILSSAFCPLKTSDFEWDAT